MQYTEWHDGEAFTVEKFKGMLLADLGRLFAEEPDVEVSDMVDFNRDRILLRVKQEIWGQKLSEVRVKYPADWWQALKERWLPQWALARWPVRYAETYIDVLELYPKWRPPITEHTRVTRISGDKARVGTKDADSS